MKVAVIGAGVCGLPAIKSSLEMGFDVVCFERRDGVGGLWNYSEDTNQTDGLANDSLGRVMPFTVTNLSKETLSYSDFLVPREFPQFLPHTKYLEYLRMYAEHFRLTDHIRFHTDVTCVRQATDIDQSNAGRWVVISNNLQTGSTSTEFYDAVLVCVGHDGVKYMPQFEGLQDFKGHILHSQDYR
jgi:dimethylaniline monooxygenase (N-oxide forming)